MSEAGSDTQAQIGALRQKLLRKQYYAIFMTPPAPMEDPIAAMGPTLKDHLRFQIADRLDAFFETGGLEFGPWIAAWLFQFQQNIRDGRKTKTLIYEQRRLQLFQGASIPQQAFYLQAGVVNDALHYGIGFRMHGRPVQGITAIYHTQETRGLFEGLRA